MQERVLPGTNAFSGAVVKFAGYVRLPFASVVVVCGSAQRSPRGGARAKAEEPVPTFDGTGSSSCIRALSRSIELERSRVVDHGHIVAASADDPLEPFGPPAGSRYHSMK